ncbi:Efflux pump periplasmic linker BepF [bacterium BMS3Bbin06]|nr:Efflux pump periplasmic linker BepF [bacterium BMS3Bbin06]HDO35972.1 efflux RND transporter periplasmic adaptor subunit [Nitrospirota bacterium]HDY70750.1 efflux RND transporter periplasmic adaptor subunit [Nitrospirota bacterium]
MRLPELRAIDAGIKDLEGYKRRGFLMLLPLLCILLLIPVLWKPRAVQAKPKGMPPALVVTAPVQRGVMAPRSDFVGTVYFREISDVSSEVTGRVQGFTFEEGRRVKKDAVLVRLSSALLEKDIEAKKALYRALLAEIEKAEKDFKRVENLYREDSIAGQVYDDHYFNLKSLKSRRDALEAEIERLDIELQKHAIRAPFDGVVLERLTARGEWLSPGSKVAKVALYDRVDVVIDLPEEDIRYVKRGEPVTVTISGKAHKGRIRSIVPRGDISTRTFPVKIDLKNTGNLKQGMDATVTIATGRKVDTLIVPRDAVISMFGRTVVFTVLDGKAKMLPATIVGYEGLKAGIRAPGLKEGMPVVIKGNERLRNGQPVRVGQNQ